MTREGRGVDPRTTTAPECREIRALPRRSLRHDRICKIMERDMETVSNR